MYRKSFVAIALALAILASNGACTAWAALASQASSNGNRLAEEIDRGIGIEALAAKHVIKAEVVFVVDVTGSMSKYVTNIKNCISDFYNYFGERFISLKTGLIIFKDVKYDGWDTTKVVTANGSPWLCAVDMCEKLEIHKPTRGEGGDIAETPLDALGYLVDGSSMHWSSDAHKFAVLFTDAKYKEDNRHGYVSLQSLADALAAKNICTSVITDSNLYSSYSPLKDKTNGIIGDLKSNDFSKVMEDYAESVVNTAKKSKKAIYVLPGYLGSKLYDRNGTGDMLWIDPVKVAGPIFWKAADKDKFVQDSYGNPGVLEIDLARDEYGTFDHYKALMLALKSRFDKPHGGDYDVIFWPYSWLADLNDCVVNMERNIAEKGYTEIIFVTHSTGGLLASAYISKSIENKRSVEKAVLVAAPLFGTYATLLPIERGVSVETGNPFSFGFWIDALTDNGWVKKWSSNSPTAYQLLPSIEYLQQLPLVVNGSWFSGDENITTADRFYRLLNLSENMNTNLTDGTNRSHRHFREISLRNSVVNQWAFTRLQEIDAMLIGTPTGHSTPAYAIYKETNNGAGRELKSLKYDKNGDGTVQGISAKAIRKDDAKPVLASNFTFNIEHGKLVQNETVIDIICNYIAYAGTDYAGTGASAGARAGGGVEYRAASDLFEDGIGMSGLINIDYECDKNIDVKIYDEFGSIVAQAKGFSKSGFDGNDFIYNSYAYDEKSSVASIYMPNKGFKIVFSYGNAAGVKIDFTSDVSTLAPDGWDEVSIHHVANVTGADGVIAVFDGTIKALDRDNIASVVGGDVVTYYTDWKLPDTLKLNINDSQDMTIIGSQAPSVAPLLKWDSSDESVVSVSKDGRITAKGYGKATISASDGNKPSVCLVTVIQNAAIAIVDDIEMIIGERTLITPRFVPNTATEVDMRYSTSANGIIEISEFGVIRALSAGTAKVVGTTSYGVRAEFVVRVIDNKVYAVQSLNMAPASVSLAQGSSAALTVTVNPQNAANKKICWYVDDDKVARLSTATGIATNATIATVTGKSEGSAKVIAVSDDGGYVAMATVTVTSPSAILNAGGGGDGGGAGSDGWNGGSPPFEAEPAAMLKAAGTEGQTLSSGEAMLPLPDGSVLKKINDFGQGWVNPFFDVEEGDWFYHYVKVAHICGALKGTSAATFSPNQGMTRAMFAQALANLEGADLSVYGASRFSDVPGGQWYTAAAEWAADQGVMLGYGNGMFGPEDEISREEIAVAIYNYAQRRGIKLFTDAEPVRFDDESKISEWALNAVKAIRAAGIIDGKPGNLYDPNAKATRAEAAAIFARFMLL